MKTTQYRRQRPGALREFFTADTSGSYPGMFACYIGTIIFGITFLLWLPVMIIASAVSLLARRAAPARVIWSWAWARGW